MIKRLSQLIALLLIPCLVADPVTAAVFQPTPLSVHPIPIHTFSEQALVSQYVSSEFHPRYLDIQNASVRIRLIRLAKQTLLAATTLGYLFAPEIIRDELRYGIEVAVLFFSVTILPILIIKRIINWVMAPRPSELVAVHDLEILGWAVLATSYFSPSEGLNTMAFVPQSMEGLIAYYLMSVVVGMVVQRKAKTPSTVEAIPFDQIKDLELRIYRFSNEVDERLERLKKIGALNRAKRFEKILNTYRDGKVMPDAGELKALSEAFNTIFSTNESPYALFPEHPTYWALYKKLEKRWLPSARVREQLLNELRWERWLDLYTFVERYGSDTQAVAVAAGMSERNLKNLLAHHPVFLEHLMTLGPSPRAAYLARLRTAINRTPLNKDQRSMAIQFVENWFTNNGDYNDKIENLKVLTLLLEGSPFTELGMSNYERDAVKERLKWTLRNIPDTEVVDYLTGLLTQKRSPGRHKGEPRSAGRHTKQAGKIIGALFLSFWLGLATLSAQVMRAPQAWTGSHIKIEIPTIFELIDTMGVSRLSMDSKPGIRTEQRLLNTSSATNLRELKLHITHAKAGKIRVLIYKKAQSEAGKIPPFAVKQSLSGSYEMLYTQNHPLSAGESYLKIDFLEKALSVPQDLEQSLRESDLYVLVESDTDADNPSGAFTVTQYEPIMAPSTRPALNQTTFGVALSLFTLARLLPFSLPFEHIGALSLFLDALAAGVFLMSAAYNWGGGLQKKLSLPAKHVRKFAMAA